MGIKRIIRFYLRCDGCRKVLINEDGWKVEECPKISKLMDAAEEAGWVSYEGKFYCPKCQEKLGIKVNKG